MICPLFIASLTIDAPPLVQGQDGSYLQWLTNTIFVAALMVIGILILARRATARMQIVPTGEQNYFEALVEGLYNFLETIVGKRLIARTFPFFATLFIYIVVSNLCGLLPGVGTIGWGPRTGPFSVSDVHLALFRPATSDLNTTFGLAIVAFILWIWWTLSEVGIGGMLKEIFAPKGIKAPMFLMVILVGPFFFVLGLIEVVTIIFRPVTLSFRLFGNIFAGENLLYTMRELGVIMHWPAWLAFISSYLLPLPFYFLEILVAVLQAFIFMLLCAVYLQLSTSHSDEDAH